MDILSGNNLSAIHLETGADECYRRDRGKEHLLLRYCRKQYRCITIFMAMVIVLLSFLNTILSNIDKDLLNNIANGVTLGSNKTTHYMKKLMLMLNSSLDHHQLHSNTSLMEHD